MKRDEWGTRFAKEQKKFSILEWIFWSFFIITAGICVAGSIAFVWVVAHFLSKFW